LMDWRNFPVIRFIKFLIRVLMGLWDEFYEKASSFFNNDEGGEASQVRKRCYYELLEVRRDATEDDIKKSYKKLALKYHPDKNPDRKEECTSYFILVQQAYEVLTDPQERAFYDKHRENIISGSSAEERKDTGLNLYPFFQKCYRGYDDSEDGFFNIYRQLFDKLASEEFPYLEGDEKDFPSFGTSTSDYDQVVSQFYDRWLYFSTQRSFAWLDRHDLRQAEDRYTIKCMEKENKKYRDSGKKQRNEEIRNLVQFVRRRDPRVKAYCKQMEHRKQKEFQRVEEQRKNQILENLRKFNEKEMPTNFTDEYLDDLDKIENDLNDQFGAFGVNEDGEIDPDSYYCVACEKKFRTSKSFTNHQKTKNHKQAVEDLKKFMAEDDQELNEGEPIEEPALHESDHEKPETLEGFEAPEEVEDSKPKGKKKKKGKKNKNLAE